MRPLQLVPVPGNETPKWNRLHVREPNDKSTDGFKCADKSSPRRKNASQSELHAV